MFLKSVSSLLVSGWEDVGRPGKVAAPLEINRRYPANVNTAAADDGGTLDIQPLPTYSRNEKYSMTSK